MTTVIYVEDEPAIAELLRSGLDLFGINVAPIYGNAEDAYDMIMTGEGEVGECEMMIFDIRLPGMTGLELTDRLRRNGEARPILIVSAYNSPSQSELQGLNAHFMPKPFDFKRIADKIEELVG